MTYPEQLNHPKWQKKRLEIMQRDKFICLHCKTEDVTLNVHHICYIKGLKVWEYDDELLITLCKDCHKIIHELTKVFALIAKDFILNKTDILDYGRE